MLCIAVPVAFILGYQQGKSRALNQILDTTSVSVDNNGATSHIGHQQTDTLVENIQKAAQKHQHTTSEPDNKVVTTQTEKQEQTSKLPAQDADVMELLSFLLTISASNDPDDMELFSPALNLLKQSVKDNPENIQVLLDYFLMADADSRAPYYITSVLQGSNIPDKNFILNNLIQSLSIQGTQNANTKMLHLVASTGAHHDNPLVIQNIKNIAIYDNEINDNRLYALDLLMPFQLKEEEKFKVVNDFKSALETVNSEQKSYWIENIIRFSPKQERNQLASTYLESNNDFSTRVAILSTLHNGSVKPDGELKQQLFQIAQDPNDPLTRHAKDALLYVFDISNEEYQLLESGGG